MAAAVGSCVQGRAATGLPEAGADILRAERAATCSTSGRRQFLSGSDKKTLSLELQREVQWLSPVSSSWDQPHCLRKMDLEGLKPDAEFFAQVALAGARAGDLQACKQLYLRALTTGLDIHPSVGSALIRMYASSRGALVDDPGKLFTIAGTDVYAWTSVITSAGQRCGRRAIEVFQAMDMNGVKPDTVTYAAVLGVCTRLRDLQQGRKIHERIVAESLEMDTNLGIHLISMYSATSCIQEAGRVFRLLRHKPDLVLWTSLITRYVKHGWMSEAMGVFKQMDLEGVKPNAITFTTILPACSLVEGARVHSRAAAEGMGSNYRLATALISMYAGHGELLQARKVFDSLVSRDVFSWTSMISAYAQQERLEEAVLLYRRMQLEGTKPTEITFVTMLDLCASTASAELGRMIHVHLIQSGLQWRTMAGNAVVNVYGKCGLLEQAKRCFMQIEHRDEISWGSLITACFHNGGEGAVFYYCKMLLEGVQPTEVTIVSVLNACAVTRDLVNGRRIHGQISSSSVVVQSTLVHMYGRCGSLEEARCVFDEMQQKSVVSWTAMIAAYAQCGYQQASAAAGHMALKLLWAMQLEGVRPNALTFTSVLSACVNASLQDHARLCFLSMLQDHDLTPTVEHICCTAKLDASPRRRRRGPRRQQQQRPP